MIKFVILHANFNGNEMGKLPLDLVSLFLND